MDGRRRKLCRMVAERNGDSKTRNKIKFHFSFFSPPFFVSQSNNARKV